MRTLPSSLAEKLAASMPLFAESGLEKTTMDGVAEATGIPRATLYYYFSSKEDIFTLLLADGLRLVQEEVAKALQADGSAAHQLAAVIRAQLEIMNKHPQVSRAMFSELERAERIPQIAAAIEAGYYSPVAQLLASGNADRSIRHVNNIEETVMTIFGAVSITGLHYLVRDGAVPEGAADRIIELVLHGITGAAF